MEWRVIKDWPAYEVSEAGDVRRIRPENSTYVGRIIKPIVGTNGYAMLSLSCDGRIKRFCVHALVCEAFHGPRPSKTHAVAHNDGCRTNNASTNLRWATHYENSQDRIRHGRSLRGEQNPRAKITDEQRREIVRRWECTPFSWGEKGPWIEAVAIEYGMSAYGIREIVNNRRIQQ